MVISAVDAYVFARHAAPPTKEKQP